MEISNFNFLNNVTIEETVPQTRTSKSEKNPTNGAHLRVFRDGSIYPSQEFVDAYKLEYNNKNSEEASYGLDVVPTNHWGAYPQGVQHVLLLAVVKDTEQKVDLFSSSKYNEDGTPKNSVMEQGSTSAGQHFLNLYCEVYGTTEEELFAENNYVDFVCATPVVLSSNGVYNFPKQITRGPKKGEWTYVTRLRPTVLPVARFNANAEDVQDAVIDTVEDHVDLQPGEHVEEEIHIDNAPFGTYDSEENPSGDLY